MMSPRPADSFPSLLEQALRKEPGRPLITAYDEATGARTELSVTTYANWVAKTANLFLDEYLLDQGDRVRIDLPVHWLGPVLAGGALLAGLTITDEEDADLLVCALPGLDDWDGSGPVVACSLTPFATPFTETLPEGVDDYGKLWPGQSDVFGGLPPQPETAAIAVGGRSLDQAGLIASAREEWPGAERLLTDVDLAGPTGLSLLLGALAGGGSLVQVAQPRDADWTTRYAAERPTRVVAG
jgi:uncharacterized protein (TIGR03089 family)